MPPYVAMFLKSCRRKRRVDPLIKLEKVGLECIVELFVGDNAFVENVASEYGNFISKLGMSHPDFRNVLEEYRRRNINASELIADLLLKWIHHCQQNNESATIQLLYDTLRSIGNVALAEILEEKHGLAATVVEPCGNKGKRIRKTCRRFYKPLKTACFLIVLCIAVYLCTCTYLIRIALNSHTAGKNTELDPTTESTTAIAIAEMPYNQEPKYNLTGSLYFKQDLAMPTVTIYKESHQSDTSVAILTPTPSWTEASETSSVTPVESFSNPTTRRTCEGNMTKKVIMEDYQKKITRNLLTEACVREWKELEVHIESARRLRFTILYATNLKILRVGMEICKGLEKFNGALPSRKYAIKSNIEQLILDPMMSAECSGKFLIFMAKHVQFVQLQYLIFPNEFLISELNIEGVNFFLENCGGNLKELIIEGGFHVFNESFVAFKNVNFIRLERLIINNTAAYSTFDLDIAKNLVKGSSGSPLQWIIINIPFHYQSWYLISHYHKSLAEVELKINLDETSVFDFKQWFGDSSSLKRVSLELIDRYYGSCSGKTISLVNFDKKSIPESCEMIKVGSLCNLKLFANSIGFKYNRNGNYDEYNFNRLSMN